MPDFLHKLCLEFRPNSSILVSSDQRILFRLSVIFFFSKHSLMRGFRLATRPYSPNGVAVMVVLLEDSPISTQDLWSSARVTTGFLITSHIEAFLLRLLSLAERPALGRDLAVPNFFHLRIIEATVLLVFALTYTVSCETL